MGFAKKIPVLIVAFGAIFTALGAIFMQEGLMWAGIAITLSAGGFFVAKTIIRYTSLGSKDILIGHITIDEGNTENNAHLIIKKRVPLSIPEGVDLSNDQILIDTCRQINTRDLDATGRRNITQVEAKEFANVIDPDYKSPFPLVYYFELEWTLDWSQAVDYAYNGEDRTSEGIVRGFMKIDSPFDVSFPKIPITTDEIIGFDTTIQASPMWLDVLDWANPDMPILIPGRTIRQAWTRQREISKTFDTKKEKEQVWVAYVSKLRKQDSRLRMENDILRNAVENGKDVIEELQQLVENSNDSDIGPKEAIHEKKGGIFISNRGIACIFATILILAGSLMFFLSEYLQYLRLLTGGG